MVKRTPLNPIELVDLTLSVAAEVLHGRHPDPQFDPHRRWHQRLHHDQLVDVWLLSWLPAQGTALHDHGGSGGAFAVVGGELAEAVHLRRGPRAGSLDERVHPVGTAVGFDRHHVHDVRNLSNRPAVSVHAYSPPLASMTFYDVRAGQLVATSTVATDEPEPLPVPSAS